jgi:hypothetical protein
LHDNKTVCKYIPGMSGKKRKSLLPITAKNKKKGKKEKNRVSW